jgi:uncharacterized protein YdeI (YjbR/CyaY-like superfamily)
MASTPMEAQTFTGPEAFRAWLERHHDGASELLVRCFKNHAAPKGLTYFQALDEALCFGWIDGVRRSIDADTFSVRFSARRSRSKWSAANTERALALVALGRMRPAGLAAFQQRAEGDSKTAYSYESRPQELSPALLRRLRANARASTFFDALPPGHRRTCVFWVMSAKQEVTRARRLDVAIACWKEGQRIPPLKPAREPGENRPRRAPKGRGGKS